MALNELQIPYPDFEVGQIINPEQTDLNNLYLQNKINSIIDVVNKITDSVADGGSGADSISLTPIAPFASNKLQAFLEEVINRLRSTKDGSSGADFISSTIITGVTGDTVQAQLKSLKAILDAEKLRVNSLINTEILNVKNLITTERGRIDSLASASSKQASDITTLNNQMVNHNHDSRYMTRTELAPYLQGGDTQIFVDVFIIETLDNGNGTFTYKNARTGTSSTGRLGNSGEMVFTLASSNYQLGMNHIKVTINDTLHRSVASGGLTEISPTEVALTSPEAIGTEVTFEYFHRIGVTGEFSIHYGTNQPPPTSGSIMWFKVVG